jgi:hypothetical protein
LEALYAGYSPKKTPITDETVKDMMIDIGDIMELNVGLILGTYMDPPTPNAISKLMHLLV